MLTRRELISAAAMGGAVVAARDAGGAPALACTPGEAGAWAGKHAVAPLPFASSKLKGISERLITSHHDNNYAGAVKNLNKVEAELAQVSKDTAPFVVGGLMQSALTYRNSMILHERYFGNLGGDGKPASSIATALAAEFGTVERWEVLFRATAASLAGGSGWVILGYDFTAGALVTVWSGNHTQGLADSDPLLVMDMYEHAYQMDYGAAAAKYIDAFFANVSWEEVNQRYERALKQTQGQSQ